jgi:hypothetical protein
MWLTLGLLWLEYAEAVSAAVDRVHWWGPPFAAIGAGVALTRTLPDSVRARVRTLSALRSQRGPLKPLTCPDTRPDMSADACPDVSGRGQDGGH